MPQLDRIIIFPQIFWLFVVFTAFYSVLTHFFLPKFLRVLKARKIIVSFNEQQAIQATRRCAESETKLKETLAEDLEKVKEIFSQNPTFNLRNLKKLETKSVDEAISTATKNSILFCNSQVLDSIEMRCKWFNNMTSR